MIYPCANYTIFNGYAVRLQEKYAPTNSRPTQWQIDVNNFIDSTPIPDGYVRLDGPVFHATIAKKEDLAPSVIPSLVTCTSAGGTAVAHIIPNQ